MASGQNAIANLLGTVNANGALLVTLDGGTGSATLFLAGDGTAAAPSYSFTSATNTGWYRGTSSGRLLGTVAGTAQAAVDSSTGFIATRSDGFLGFLSSTALDSAGLDTYFSRISAGVMGLPAAQTLYYGDANGQALTGIQRLTELTTIAAAATTDTTIQMPAGAVILGVSVRTTVVIPTATSYSVGDSGLATRFNTANVGVAANSTDPGTKAGAYYNASALSVRLTMNGGTPAANTGRVRVTIYYYTVTPPSS